MCGGKKKRKIKMPDMPNVTAAAMVPVSVQPIEADENVKLASEEERRKRKLASGRTATILTGGLGDSSTAKVGRKTLGGM